MGRRAQIITDKEASGCGNASGAINRKLHGAVSAPRVLVIGGGPAGLTAAIAAARAGADVSIAERMDRTGKKLLASGNGRCNLSNISLAARNYHGPGAEAAYSIISQYGLDFVTSFFESVGILTSIEDRSRVYPSTFSSSTVLNALRSEAARLGVIEMCSCEALSVKPINGEFHTFFRDAPVFISDRVIVAAGGKASPFLGSDGSGYGLLTALGHGMVPPAPALAPLRLAVPEIRGLKGVRVRAGLTLFARGGDIIYRETGELIFSDYGVSGIPALNASCHIARHAGGERPAGFFLAFDLYPERTEKELCGFINNRLLRNPPIPPFDILNGMAHKQIAALVMKRAAAACDNPLSCAPGRASDHNMEYAGRLAGALKDWRISINGVGGFENAQVTYGGLSFADFNADTLESNLVKGLYAAGEILDATGDCGGYNLHWAWASGYLAGIGAARA